MPLPPADPDPVRDSDSVRDSDPVRMTLTMVVDAVDAERFVQRHRAAARHAESFPGFLAQGLQRRALRAQAAVEFVVTSDWSSRNAFHRFETDPEQGRITEPLAQLRRSARMELAGLSGPSTATEEGTQR